MTVALLVVSRAVPMVDDWVARSAVHLVVHSAEKTGNHWVVHWVLRWAVL